VINAAFEVLRRQGFDAVTARNVAVELGSSTTPIYWVFQSMDAVEEALHNKAMQLMIEFQSKKYTDNVFTNMAIGYVDYARQEPRLFQFLQHEQQKPYNPSESEALGSRMSPILGDQPPVENYFGKIDQKSMDGIALRSWIFMHGLAVAISSHMLEFNSEKEIENLIISAGRAFYLDQTIKKE
jgi:AcrR family transcriptional regulator